MQSPFSENAKGHLWAVAFFFSAVPLSVGIHIAGLLLLPPRLPPNLAQNQPVEMEILRPPPPPEELEPEPEPEPPTPPPPKPPPVRPPPAKPPPSQAPPPPHEEAAQKPDKPVPIVAGVSLSSTTEAGTFSAPVGNTGYGSMKGPATNPEEVKPYRAEAYALPSEVDEEPKVLSEFKPPYPEEARKAGMEGSVRLRLWIDAQGKVQQVRVLRKAGYGLDEAAQEAIKRFQFKPAKKGGKHVPISFTFDFHFYLD
jgi:protein TonB